MAFSLPGIKEYSGCCGADLYFEASTLYPWCSKCQTQPKWITSRPQPLDPYPPVGGQDD